MYDSQFLIHEIIALYQPFVNSNDLLLKYISTASDVASVIISVISVSFAIYFGKLNHKTNIKLETSNLINTGYSKLIDISSFNNEAIKQAQFFTLNNLLNTGIDKENPECFASEDERNNIIERFKRDLNSLCEKQDHIEDLITNLESLKIKQISKELHEELRSLLISISKINRTTRPHSKKLLTLTTLTKLREYYSNLVIKQTKPA